MGDDIEGVKLEDIGILELDDNAIMSGKVDDSYRIPYQLLESRSLNSSSEKERGIEKKRKKEERKDEKRAVKKMKKKEEKKEKKDKEKREKEMNALDIDDDAMEVYNEENGRDDIEGVKLEDIGILELDDNAIMSGKVDDSYRIPYQLLESRSLNSSSEKERDIEKKRKKEERKDEKKAVKKMKKKEEKKEKKDKEKREKEMNALDIDDDAMEVYNDENGPEFAPDDVDEEEGGENSVEVGESGSPDGSTRS